MATSPVLSSHDSLARPEDGARSHTRTMATPPVPNSHESPARSAHGAPSHARSPVPNGHDSPARPEDGARSHTITMAASPVPDSLGSPARPADGAHSPYTAVVSSVHVRNYDARFERIKEFGEKLRRTIGSALLLAMLQHVSRFASVCALTWATVVLLGGFASELHTIDFYFVSSLLLVAAARLSTTIFFSKLVRQRLVWAHQDPESREYKDAQPELISWIHVRAEILHFLLALFSLAMTVVRFALYRSPSNFGDKPNLAAALTIFYVLVLLHSLSALLYSICRVSAITSCPGHLKTFYDEVFLTAFTVGVVEAYSFDHPKFALNTLKQDFLRDVTALAIEEENRHWIFHLYDHPRGVELVCQYLESNDAIEQQVAANMVGFWAGQDRIEFQRSLLDALADKLGRPGRIGEAAANSFGALAKEWRERADALNNPVLQSRNKKGNNVVDILVDLITSRRTPSLLAYLRALSRCLEHKEVARRLRRKEKRKRKLEKKFIYFLSRESSVRERNKIFAASALRSLVGLTQRDREAIAKIHPEGGELCVWKDEKELLDDLNPGYKWKPDYEVLDGGLRRRIAQDGKTLLEPKMQR